MSGRAPSATTSISSRCLHEEETLHRKGRAGIAEYAKALCRAQRRNIPAAWAFGRYRARIPSLPLRKLRDLCGEVLSFCRIESRMRRIGIDVGGTNTDAVLLEEGRVVHAVKSPTTEDVTRGILAALDLLRQHPEVTQGR